MKADETVANAPVVAARIPAAVTVERSRQAQATCHVAAARHFELSLEIQLTANPGVGEPPQLTRFQTVCEIGTSAGQANLSLRSTKLPISFNRAFEGGAGRRGVVSARLVRRR